MARKLPQHFLFPRVYFRAQARGIAPVPAYFFHQIDPKGFADMCAAIAAKGIRTLTFTELLDDPPGADPAVALTLDDGWSSAWSLALPIARRHGVRLTLFATPQTVEETGECRSTLDDGVPAEELAARDRGERPLLTWGELGALHESGVVEVQSHSLHHAVVFNSNRLRAWVDGTPQPWQSGNIPLLRRVMDADVPQLASDAGTPLADVGPALVEERRFILDESFAAECVARAAQGRDRGASVGDRLPGRWESPEERNARFFDDLHRARQMLSARLPGCTVRVLAPPWARMHPTLPRIAREAGYAALAVGYPSSTPEIEPALPVTPRLYGEGLWTLVHGAVLGTPAWLTTRRHNLARRAAGIIP